MSTEAIRQQLYDYIRVAEDRKLQAIYTILEAELDTAPASWSDNPALVAEIDRRTEEYKTGKVQSIAWEDVKAQILSKGK